MKCVQAQMQERGGDCTVGKEQTFGVGWGMSLSLLVVLKLLYLLNHVTLAQDGDT